MNATDIFKEILQRVETSELNYAVSKTPFSATISLKCSFAKRYQNPSSAQSNKTIRCKNNVSDTIVKSEDPNISAEKFEKEIKTLKSKIELLETTVTEQNKMFLVKSKQMKEAVKSAEDQASLLREDLLKVKRERNEAGSRNKALENEIEVFRVEANNVKVEHKKMIQNKKENTTEIKNLKNDIESLKRLNENLKQNLEKEYESLGYKCEQCDHKTRGQRDLKDHILTIHYRNKCIQAELDDNIISTIKTKFADYSCFYCRKIIVSVQDLEDHKPVCYSIEDFAPYPCDVCGAQCPQEDDLGRHRTTYHELGTFSEDLGMEIFWCDICPITTRSKSDLDVHIGCCHQDGYK